MKSVRVYRVHWESTGSPLGVHWESTGSPLGLYWEYTGSPLGVYRESTGSPLGVYRESTGSPLGVYWESTHSWANCNHKSSQGKVWRQSLGVYKEFIDILHTIGQFHSHVIHKTFTESVHIHN